MKFKILAIIFLLSFTVQTYAKEAQKMSDSTTEKLGIQILDTDHATFNPGPEAYFTGKVTVAPMFKETDPSALSCGCVNFQAGSRSAWHTHPKGQLLVIKEGSGYVQEWGKPIRIIKKGDLIWTPPGVKHWHGASPDSSMLQFAVQESHGGKNVEWLEKVSDTEYMRTPQ